MKNLIVYLLPLLFLPSKALWAQEPDAKVSARQSPSVLLGKDVTLLVRLPDTYKSSKKQYPVLFYIQGTAQTVEEVATICQNSHDMEGSPEMIVVGVDVSDENLSRMTDLKKYDTFLSYLEKELQPAIRKQYRTNGRSVMYEKSLFGSLALYAFLHKPNLCQGYIAASKQWYETNNDAFNGWAKKALKNPQQLKGRNLFLATLNGAYNNNDIQAVDQQMQTFSGLLNAKSGNKGLAKYQAFDDWGITPQPGFKEGLLFVSPKGLKKKTASLTMTQTSTGQWVIMDRQKTVLYDVFIYDNGPDYPAEGLIRVVKNGKIGYADAKTYAIVIAPQFDCAFPFENGKAKVSHQCRTIKDGEYSVWESDAWKYVDKKGKF
jgi:predicted alpha/beta superfamily hydrolase